MQKQNLFVSSIAYKTTDDDLKAYFEQVGEVASAKIIMDRESGRSKGFGFVEFVNEEDNQKAIDQFNGKDLDGRTLNIAVARPREERPRRDNDGGDGGSFRKRSW